MAVLIDISAKSSPGAVSVTSDTFAPGVHNFTLAIGTGPNGTTNLALIVAVLGVGATAGTSSGMSATWDNGGTNQAMTQIGTSADSTGDLWLFGLLAPTQGSKTLALSWTGSNQMLVTAASYVNVTQASIAAAFKNFAKANGTTSPNSISPTNASGDIAFAGHVTNGNYTSGSGTDVGHDNTGNLNSAAGNYDSTANPTLTYTFTGGTKWSSVACSVSAGAVVLGNYAYNFGGRCAVH